MQILTIPHISTASWTICTQTLSPHKNTNPPPPPPKATFLLTPLLSQNSLTSPHIPERILSFHSPYTSQVHFLLVARPLGRYTSFLTRRLLVRSLFTSDPASHFYISVYMANLLETHLQSDSTKASVWRLSSGYLVALHPAVKAQTNVAPASPPFQMGYGSVKAQRQSRRLLLRPYLTSGLYTVSLLSSRNTSLFSHSIRLGFFV